MNSHQKKQLLTILGWTAGGGAFLLCLPLSLPVLLGLLAAVLLDPLIVRVQKGTGIRRSAASALCVTGSLLGLGAGLWLLGRLLIREAVSLSHRLPEILETIAGYAAALTRWIAGVGQRLPGGAGDAFSAWAEGIMGSSGSLAQSLYTRIFSLVSGFLGALPNSLFFLMTMVLSVYFAAGELPRLRELLAMGLPLSMKRRYETVTRSIRQALGGWLRAQVMLMGVTFFLLTVGFMVLGVDSPLLLGLMVSLLDALPLFGTGTVLIPWSLVSMMTGEMGLGLGLLGLYAGAALTRNVLEPKLLGAQLGLSPLLTLVAIYAGWRLGGLGGLILFPMGLMVAAQLWQSAHAPDPAPSPRGVPFRREI